MNILEKIFSITNTPDKKHKIVTILGLKIAININKNKTIKKTQKNYEKVLKRIRQKEKIRVLFLINEISKWKTKSLYNLMKESKDFEPVITLNIADWQWNGLNLEERAELIDKNQEYFNKQGIECIIAYDKITGKAIDLEKFEPDIVFYQQPYMYNKTHEPLRVSEFALTYYIPYYVPNYWIPHLYWWRDFHRHLFRYYQPNKEWADCLSNFVKKNKKEKVKNIVGIGHTMLDEFYLKKNIISSNNYVIYAPHWSIKHEKNKNAEYYSTFLHNHKEILEYAKTHPEFNWVFKPHPTLKRALIRSEVMTEEEVDNYYNEWAKIGQCSYDSNYVDLFLDSKALITDCGSFLIEYFATGKPLIHLISKDCIPKPPKFVQEIFDTYYKVNNNKELYQVLDNILINNNDYLKEKRHSVLKKETWLNSDNAENILNDIRRTLNAKS